MAKIMTISGQGGAQGSLLASILAPAVLAVQRMAAWRQRQRDMDHLQALSDHQLKDIGIARSEIQSAVLSGRCRHG